MHEYERFIRKNFHKREYFIGNYASILYSRICENSYFLDIVNYILNTTKGMSDKKLAGFIIKYINCFNRILLYISINDTFAYRFCLRNSIENLLKLIYCIVYDVEAKNVINIGFRNLKKELLSQPEQLDNINKLCNLYSNLSNDIHLKNIVDKVNIEYIQDSIDEDIDFRKIDKELLMILDLSQDILIHILSIDNDSLNTADRLRLIKNKNISRKRKENLLKKFNI